MGGHPAITDALDLVIDLGYTDSEQKVRVCNQPDPGDTCGFGETDGVFLRVGPRTMIGDNFELSAYLTSAWGSLDDVANDEDFRGVTLQIGGQYYFTEHFSLGADAELADAGDTIDLFARWSF